MINLNPEYSQNSPEPALRKVFSILESLIVVNGAEVNASKDKEVKYVFRLIDGINAIVITDISEKISYSITADGVLMAVDLEKQTQVAANIDDVNNIVNQIFELDLSIGV